MAKAQKKNQLQEMFDKVEATGKKAYLATLGVYGRSSDETQSRFEKLKQDSTGLFDKLAKEGESVQADLEKQVKETRGKVETQLDKVKAKVPYFNLMAKLDEVNSKLDKVVKA